ncbi:MAG: hypothetical protein ACRCW6_01975 [Mycoplasmoidaceae bacterium]
MTNTAKILLKILLNGDLHQNDLERYFDLDLNSIKKNLKILNNYLISHKLGVIKKNKNIYTLEKSKKKLMLSFSELDILSSKDREDILCIRLLLNQELNLEKMRYELSISRTSLQKDLKNLKKNLKKNYIEVESKNFKGIFLKAANSIDVKNILCEKIMQLFIGRDYLTKYQIKLLEEIDVLEINDFFETFSKITKEFKIGKFTLTFYALYSMKCIESLSESFIYEGDVLQNDSEYYLILERLNKMDIDLSLELRKFVATVILKTYHFPRFDLSFKKEFEIFINQLDKVLDLNFDEREKLYNRLLKKYQIGYLNKKYGLFWISSKEKSKLGIELANIIQRIINNSGVEMIYGDILGLSDVIVDFFVEKEYSENFKLLFIVQNIESMDKPYYKTIFNYIKMIYPKVELYIETFLDFKFGVLDNKGSYDLIISEFESIEFKNSKKICRLNIQEVQTILSEVILKKILVKFNKKNSEKIEVLEDVF